MSNRRVLGICLVIGLIGSARGVTAPQSKERGAVRTVSGDDFVSWVRKTAIPVEDWQLNPALASYLDRALEGKRLVFIGEPGHFYQEKYDVQLLLIRYLVSRGYRHIFQEGLGASMAPVFDDLVRSGKGPGAQAGLSGNMVRYRERAFAGWEGAKNPEFGRRLSASRKRFFEQIHHLNRSLPEGSAPIRVHPLDIDMMPGGCYHSISSLLARHDGEPDLDPIRELAAKVEKESLPEEIQRLERLRDLVEEDPDELLSSLPTEDRVDLRRFADCLVESIAFLDTARADGKLDRALVRREPAMYRQVQYVLERLAPGEKAIMIAHTNHLARVGSDTLRARSPSVGEMIDTAYPGQVYSIWMLHDHGELLNPMNPDLFEKLASDPDKVESLLAKAGSTYVLPLRTGAAGEQYLSRKRNYSYFSWSETGTLTLQADALFFLDEITPLR